jgi:hypothetical protein
MLKTRTMNTASHDETVRCFLAIELSKKGRIVTANTPMSDKLGAAHIASLLLEGAFGVDRTHVNRRAKLTPERAVVEGPMAALDDRPRPGQGADDHHRSQGVVDGNGVPEGEGIGLST